MYIRSVREDKSDEIFKNKSYHLLVTLIVLTIFIISGAIFLTFLGFGLYGLSRILIYLHLGDFSYNKGFYDNLIYYGSYIVLGYFTLFSIEHLMDYFKKNLPKIHTFKVLTFISSPTLLLQLCFIL